MLTFALVAATPWIVIPLIALWRARGDPSLDHESPPDKIDAPKVSVIVPARNEGANIAACVQSILSSRYPAFEVIVVDDHSVDDTLAIARVMAGFDHRVTALEAPPLPDGWFGKQWACDRGADRASGDILCFTDADTRHGRDLMHRSVHRLRSRNLDFVSVLGRQVMLTFWERLIQPQVFAMLSMRFGGAREVNQSPHVIDKLANGQYMLLTRAAYDEVGGHAAVRDQVAEDLALAQRLFEHGKRTELVDGRRYLSTRMYTSFGTLVRGWMKNIYAGGVRAAPFGSTGRALLPLVLLAGPVASLAPIVVLILAAFGLVSDAWLVWSIITTAATILWWAQVYVRAPVLGPSRALRFAAIFPLGSLILGYIIVRAVIRGRRVEWRGREYVSG
ncbi:MAG TPA: glycosyltransferase family 2 protein [Gemmatimonadaceae bacterium]|nr:glycosyltransferase family 2 protein [Gemmatimonadaceae bacterium]